MKSIKMIGLAALAALTAMALVGVSSAMATTATALCEVDQVPCEAANLRTHVHEETLVGKLAELLTELEPVKCDVLFLGEVLGLSTKNAKGEQEPQIIHGNFTYTNCKFGEEKCEVKEVSKDSLLEVLRTAHEKADVTGKGEVRVKCGSPPGMLHLVECIVEKLEGHVCSLPIDCTYDGEGLKGDAVGLLLSKLEKFGETLIHNAEVHKVAGSSNCPVKGELDILTAALEKEPTHIST